MGNKGLFPGVAVPRAFFGTFFRFERKYCPPRGGSPTVRAGVGASNPHRQKRACTCGRTKGLSSGQTIGAVRTAVRSACCLPELRVANRLRRLYPLDTRFPSFPFGNLRAPKVGKVFPWSCKPRHPRRSRRVKPSAGTFYSKAGFLPPLAQMKRTLPVIKPARFFTPQSLPF